MLALMFFLVLMLVLAMIIMVILILIFTVMWGVFIVIPIFLHEVDRLATGIIFAAVFAPIFGVAGRDMQVERLVHYTLRYWLDYHRRWEDELWLREFSDIYAAIQARLTDAD